MTDQTESAQLSKVPLYEVIRDAVKNSSDLTGQAALALSFAAVLNQLAEDGRCPDLDDSILAVIAFHEAQNRANMAELLGILECVKFRLHGMAIAEAKAEIAAEQG